MKSRDPDCPMSPQEIIDRDEARAYLRELDITPSFSVASGKHPGVMFIFLGLVWNERNGASAVLQWNNPPDQHNDRLVTIHFSRLRRWKGYENESP